MALRLGVDTGGTYTDAVILDQEALRVLGHAKALTTRGDLALGIGRAIDAALAAAGVTAAEIGLVSLSTTLATNALVEGQGARVALVAIGFDAADLDRAGLAEAMRGDPVIPVVGGHDPAGAELAPFDPGAMLAALAPLSGQIAGVAVAARFATRNPAHERAARDAIRAATGLSVTCSHDLSAGLNGPRRALTAVLNARLTPLIDGLVAACLAYLARAGIDAPLMVVRGDGSLMAADLVRDRPIETILSGPAASIVGARWLTGETDALVSDIGGTTTDIAMIRDGLPDIDPDGARVGPHRTMVEAVAMRTWGLGGDSEVHLQGGPAGGLWLGPRRAMPVALLAVEAAGMVHAALDRALAAAVPGEHDGRFAVPLGPAAGLAGRDAEVMARIAGPVPLAQVLRSRPDMAALDRLIGRGQVILAGVTPSDASHVLGGLAAWDAAAAEKALALMARRRVGSGLRQAADAAALARRIINQLSRQTADCLLEAALAADPRFAGLDPRDLAAHPLVQAGLAGGGGTVALTARLALPVVGLGASAPAYYGAVGERLGARMVLPAHAGVANAIGAVAGQVAQRVSLTVTAPGPGQFALHLPDGVRLLSDRAAALDAAARAATAGALSRARAAGAGDPVVRVTTALREAEVEGQPMFVEALVTATATGRPRLARAPAAPIPA